MLKNLIYLLVAFLAIILWTTKGADAEKQCFYEGFHFKQGEIGPGPLGKCYGMLCNDPKINHKYIKRCKKLEVPPNCVALPKDLTKQYPECCSKISCPEEE